MEGHVFGPVPSRRLGRSLGVDLVPFKTCSYDCIYCQLGRTSCKTLERKEWISIEDVLAELRCKLATKPDYITLSGSGEPTLFSRLGELIGRIKVMTDVPVAVLTNGSLLWREEVRSQLLEADLVIPSLDAGDPAMFRFVNRPHEDLDFENVMDGLVRFGREFQGEYWLEVFLLGGYTSIKSEVLKLARCARCINPDRIQLNTVTRPPAEDYAFNVPRERMNELAVMFDPVAEVIADFRGVHQQPEFAAGREDVLTLLKRRPCSIEDLSSGLGFHRNEAIKYVEELKSKNLVEEKWVSGRLYYVAGNDL
ncbi:MAG: radical SAM protein [Candidatus Omnitrophica bacterium]|nr:radical SAM protein [Candidatus Omnitrophota bacterium]